MTATVKNLTAEIVRLDAAQKFGQNAKFDLAMVNLQLEYVALLTVLLTTQKQSIEQELTPPKFTASEMELLRAGAPKKIALIKAIRERTGMGLDEAKLHVEQGHVDLGYGTLTRNDGYWSFNPNSSYPQHLNY